MLKLQNTSLPAGAGRPLRRTARLAAALAILTPILAVPALAGSKAIRYTGRSGLALDGYDAVAYFTESKAVRGDARYETTWDGVRWRFVSASNRDRFVKDPQMFAPQFGGYCAYAVSQGHTASGDPEAWSVVDGKLYVNYSQSVRATWEKDRTGYIAQAQHNWPAVLAK